MPMVSCRNSNKRWSQASKRTESFRKTLIQLCGGVHSRGTLGGSSCFKHVKHESGKATYTSIITSLPSTTTR